MARIGFEERVVEDPAALAHLETLKAIADAALDGVALFDEDDGCEREVSEALRVSIDGYGEYHILLGQPESDDDSQENQLGGTSKTILSFTPQLVITAAHIEAFSAEQEGGFETRIPDIRLAGFIASTLAHVSAEL